MGALGYFLGVVFFILAIATILFETVGRALRERLRPPPVLGQGQAPPAQIDAANNNNNNSNPQPRANAVRRRRGSISSNEDPLSPSRYQPAPGESTRIRQEQDQEYEQSLRADRERERKEEAERKAAEAAARAEEQRAREEEQRKQAKEQRRKEKASQFSKAEPAAGPDVSQIAFRLPDGTRLQRRFPKDTQLKVLFDFVEVNSTVQEGISLSTNFPKMTYADPNDSRTLDECKLHPHASLFVHSTQL